jgi:DnaJ-class molecular chaperone
VICEACDGSGEGMTAGTTCPVCHGLGEVFTSGDPDLLEGPEWEAD